MTTPATTITLDELADDPEALGWVKIHCDKCGHDNWYDPEFAKTATQCFGCMPCSEGLPK